MFEDAPALGALRRLLIGEFADFFKAVSALFAQVFVEEACVSLILEAGIHRRQFQEQIAAGARQNSTDRDADSHKSRISKPPWSNANNEQHISSVRPIALSP